MPVTTLFGFGIADFLKMLPESTKEKIREQWDSFGWEKAEIKYKQHMYALYGTTRILGKPEP